MSLDRCRPGSLLDRLGVIGYPWHGWVTNGRLELPNGQIVSHAQPATDNRVLATAAHTLAVPGAPPLDRTPEQLATDSAAGRRWLDKAILSGSGTMVYGRNLGAARMIYAADDGRRWLVDLSDLCAALSFSASSPVRSTATVIMREFGAFRAAPLPDPVQITMDVPDPLARGLGSDDGTCIVYSLHPQGQRAVLCIEAAPGEPLAWLEFELLDDAPERFPIEAGATVRVLRTGAQTLGVGASVSDSSGGGSLFLYVESWADVGHTITVYTSSDNVPIHAGLVGYGVDSFTEITTAKWSDMTLSVWYDAAGAIHQMTVDVNVSNLRKYDTKYQNGHWQSLDAGGGVISPFMLETVETREADWEILVRMDGNPASRKAWSARGTSSFLTQCLDGFLWLFDEHWEDIVSSSDAWLGSPTSYSGSRSHTYPVIVTDNMYMWPDVSLAHLSFPKISSLHGRYRLMSDVRLRTWNDSRDPTEPGSGELPSIWPGLCCFDHVAWGWVQCSRTAGGSGYSFSFYPTGQTLTRDGVIQLQIGNWTTFVTTSAYNLYGHRFSGAPYVARSPVTSEHRVSRTPICWV